MDADPSYYLKICEVADLLRVSPASVRRWISRGRLPAVRRKLPGGADGNGHYLVPRHAVLALLEEPAREPDLRARRPEDPRLLAAARRFGLG
jgi:excisionase family DNA binding protein